MSVINNYKLPLCLHAAAASGGRRRRRRERPPQAAAVAARCRLRRTPPGRQKWHAHFQVPTATRYCSCYVFWMLLFCVRTSMAGWRHKHYAYRKKSRVLNSTGWRYSQLIDKSIAAIFPRMTSDRNYINSDRFSCKCQFFMRASTHHFQYLSHKSCNPSPLQSFIPGWRCNFGTRKWSPNATNIVVVVVVMRFSKIP